MLRKGIVLVAALILAPALAQSQSWAWDDGTVPYVNTPVEIVERMMRMAEVAKGDHVIDLGSGDGRIIIAAARRGATGVGVDLDPNLVRLATQNAAKAGVTDRTRFEVKDIFETDLSQATVVAFYLLPDFNAKLLPKLLKLKPGTRIVSHDGGIADWPADETLEMKTPEKPVGIGGNSKVELWVVPANAAGTWSSDLGSHGGTWTFRIGQRYQVLDVQVVAGGRELLVRNTRLRGEEIKLMITGLVGTRAYSQYFVGQVRGDRIEGQVNISDGNNTRTQQWVATRGR